MASTSSEWTVFEGVTVIARANATAMGHDLGPCVEVAYPGSDWSRVTLYRPYPTYESAVDATRTLAGELKSLKPAGVTGFSNRRLAPKDPRQVSARQTIETTVQEWAGSDALVLAI